MTNASAPAGIEKINLYGSSLWLDLFKLAEVRKRDMDDLRDNILVRRRSLNPLYEDTVTMAVNAAKPILTEQDKQDIELLIVGTESAVDYGKPAGTWVHRFLGLNNNCRTFETKHACYSAHAGLNAALAWIRSGERPGKKALVIGSDYSRTHLGAHHEFVLGGVAVAMVVSADPQVIAYENGQVGYFTQEIADTFRPTSKVEMGNSETSLYSYLDALEGAFSNYVERTGGPSTLEEYEQRFARAVYHSPFPGMTFQAHRTVLRHLGVTKKSVARAHWEQMVLPSLRFVQELGSCYCNSNYVGLMGHLSNGTIKGGDRVGFYAYGSGSQGEYYSGIVGANAKAQVDALNIPAQLDARTEVTVDEYEAIEKMREDQTDVDTFSPMRTGMNDHFGRFYKGKGLLYLDRVDNYYRHYEWS